MDVVCLGFGKTFDAISHNILLEVVESPSGLAVNLAVLG